MQGLVVAGFIVEEISNFDVKCVKVTAAQNITVSRYLLSQYIKKKHYVRFGGCRPYS